MAGFTSDGLGRARSSPEYEAARREVVARVTAEFAPRFAEAGPFGKLVLWVKRRRRLEREIEDLAPRRAYYGRGS